MSRLNRLSRLPVAASFHPPVLTRVSSWCSTSNIQRQEIITFNPQLHILAASFYLKLTWRKQVLLFLRLLSTPSKLLSSLSPTSADVPCRPRKCRWPPDASLARRFVQYYALENNLNLTSCVCSGLLLCNPISNPTCM